MIVIKLFFRNQPLAQEMQVSRRVRNCLSSLSGVLCYSRKLMTILKFICLLHTATVHKRFFSTFNGRELMGKNLFTLLDQSLLWPDLMSQPEFIVWEVSFDNVPWVRSSTDQYKSRTNKALSSSQKQLYVFCVFQIICHKFN